MKVSQSKPQIVASQRVARWTALSNNLVFGSGWWPRGKAADCRSADRRFESDPSLVTNGEMRQLDFFFNFQSYETLPRNWGATRLMNGQWNGAGTPCEETAVICLDRLPMARLECIAVIFSASLTSCQSSLTLFIFIAPSVARPRVQPTTRFHRRSVAPLTLPRPRLQPWARLCRLF